MAHALTQTHFDFPNVVRSNSKRFLMAISDEFATVITPKLTEDWIDPTDDDEIDDEPNEGRYCTDCGGPCMYDGYSTYDTYDMSYLEDEEYKCDVAGCYDEPDTPSILCDEHGSIYNRYHVEIEDRVDRLIKEYGKYDCVYRCSITQNVHCSAHGYLYDSSFHAEEGNDRFDGDVEDNPETAEYDFVETYTDRERMLHRFYDDRRRQYDQKEATRNRYLTSTSKRNRRRDGLVQWRGHHFSWFGIEFKGYEAGRTDCLTYLETKRAYVD